MEISKKVVALGAAGVVALGGAGLYAGALTVVSGNIGAGEIAVAASCVSEVDVNPGASTWNTTTKKYEFDELIISGNFSSCGGNQANAIIYENATGNALSQASAAVQITDTGNPGDVTLELTTPVDAGFNQANYTYGVVIEPYVAP